MFKFRNILNKSLYFLRISVYVYIYMWEVRSKNLPKILSIRCSSIHESPSMASTYKTYLPSPSLHRPAHTFFTTPLHEITARYHYRETNCNRGMASVDFEHLYHKSVRSPWSIWFVWVISKYLVRSAFESTRCHKA